MTMFGIEKPKGTCKLNFILVILIIAIGISFSIGLLAGFLATKDEENHNEERTASCTVDNLLEIFNTENIKNTSRYFSHKPHTAGSQRSIELADEIRRKWTNYGLKVETFEYEVLLPQAKNNSPGYIELKDHMGEVTMRHVFAAKGKSDPKSNKTWIIPRFFFYSPPGEFSTGLLYVNEGRKEDFEYLNKINITSCNDSVLIMKQSYDSIHEQLENAYNCNASAVLLFHRFLGTFQTSGNSSVYPNGTRLPEEQPIVHSLRKWLQFGDPLTPDLPSIDGVYRLEDLNWQAKIPVQSLEFDLAIKLLELLEGSPAPEQWKLNKKTDHRIGPTLKNNLTFHLTVNSKAKKTKIYDVIGTVYGEEEPDSWVLIGNHRDAIVFGGADAVSGTSGLMELSRGVGTLLKKGWKPRRTIKFCSWAAEEIGVIGSTEYVEDNKKLLQERGVAYINMDMLVHGNDSLKASGNPLTIDLVYNQSKMVSDPHGPQETIYSVWKKSRRDLTRKDRPQYYTVGLGSDYIPFYEMAGVPSIDLQYAKVPYGMPQAYHTVYDTYHLVSMFDPHFIFHLAQTKLAARILYELSNSQLIPFNVNSFTSSLREIINRTTIAYENELNKHGITLSKLSKEVNELIRAGKIFEKIKKESNFKTNPGKIRCLNKRMVAFNKFFISPEEIPDRANMRNLVLGISQNLFYPNITLAGISDAVISAKISDRWDIVKRQVSLIHHAITQARRFLEMP